MTVLKLHIAHEGTEIPLAWTEPCWKDLIKFYRWQTGGHSTWPTQHPTVDDFISFANPRMTNDFNRLVRAIGPIDQSIKIVDVGAGIGALDLLLYQKLMRCAHTPKMFLIDRDELSMPTQLFYDPSIGYGFYNSWMALHNAISTIGLDKSDFTTMIPDDAWPDDVDLVFSTYSWCWHYPPEIYLSQLLNSLKIGGRLILDVIHRPDRNFVEEISDALGSTPTIGMIGAKHITPDHVLYNKITIKNETSGQTCKWIRNR